MVKRNDSKIHSGRDDLADKVAMGATGVALAASAVAIGAALSSKNFRTAISKGTEQTVKGIGKARDMIEEGRGRFQTFQHRIGIGKGTTGGRKRRSRK